MTGPGPPGRQPLLAANWKMHFLAGEAARYVEAFLGEPGTAEPRDPDGREVLLLVPAPLLGETVAAVRGHGIAVGAQNIHWEDRGAFTGEVSAPMVASTGATYCLVGHSERRLLFGERDADVARKLRAALRNDLRPILCVGERIEERRAGRAERTVVEQLRRALEGIETAGFGRLAVAYEPVWAIGTGETATPQIAGGMHAVLRAALAEAAGEARAAGIRILYGGSVTPANVDALLAEPEIDGALVGGASLDPGSFQRIVAFRTAADLPPVGLARLDKQAKRL